MTNLTNLQNLDSWVGSGGSKAKASDVTFPDPYGVVKCRKTNQQCAGIYVCSQFDMSIFLN